MKISVLYKIVSNELGVTLPKAKEAVEAVVFGLNHMDIVGESTIVPNFGTFKVKERLARKGRNPSTGEPMNIPASKAVTFKQSPSAKADLNK